MDWNGSHGIITESLLQDVNIMREFLGDSFGQTQLRGNEIHSGYKSVTVKGAYMV
jgi:hypothetical protein